MKNTYINTHPLVKDRLTQLRDKNASCQTFRDCLNEIALFLAVDATANLPTSSAKIETPLTTMDGDRLSGTNPLIVPILRAGLALSESLQHIISHADTGHIGLARDF